jgi:hypothetical protein
MLLNYEQLRIWKEALMPSFKILQGLLKYVYFIPEHGLCHRIITADEA